MQSYIDEHLPEEQQEKEIEKPLEIQNQLKEPEEMNQQLPFRELNLVDNSKTKRNLFGISGGSIRSIGNRYFHKY